MPEAGAGRDFIWPDAIYRARRDLNAQECEPAGLGTRHLAHVRRPVSPAMGRHPGHSPAGRTRRLAARYAVTDASSLTGRPRPAA